MVVHLHSLTPERLTDMMHPHIDSTITAVTSEVIGTGKMGDNVRLNLTYDNSDGGPATVVAKLPAADPKSREMAALTGAYRFETRFYQELAKESASRLAMIYHAEVNDTGDDFIIVMEDLAPAVPGNQIVGESLDRARCAMREAALLHSTFRGRDELAGRNYITTIDQSSADFGQQLLIDNWAGFTERFGADLTAEHIAFGDQYIPCHAEWTANYSGLMSVRHGDFRSENILFNDSAGTATTVDWQTISYGCPVADVSYFLGGSLTTSVRREHERDLVAYYGKHLAQHGTVIPDDDLWQLYREHSMYSLMIVVLGAMFTGTDKRGDAMFSLMAQRHFQQCVDNVSADFLN